MKQPVAKRRFALIFAAMAACTLSACGHHGSSSGGILPAANPQRQNAAQTYTSGSTSLTITPNYKTGFGPVYFAFHTVPPIGYLPSSPSPGAGASLGAGYVDFGGVQRGEDYLYRYAVQLNIASSTGIAVYGAASSDLAGSSGSLPVSSHLFWLPTATSTSSLYGADANDTFRSASTPFELETAGATNAASLYSSTSGTATLSYDYILRLGASDPLGSYSTSVVYTVVPR